MENREKGKGIEGLTIKGDEYLKCRKIGLSAREALKKIGVTKYALMGWRRNYKGFRDLELELGGEGDDDEILYSGLMELAKKINKWEGLSREDKVYVFRSVELVLKRKERGGIGVPVGEEESYEEKIKKGGKGDAVDEKGEEGNEGDEA